MFADPDIDADSFLNNDDDDEDNGRGGIEKVLPYKLCKVEWMCHLVTLSGDAKRVIANDSHSRDQIFDRTFSTSYDTSKPPLL